MMALGLGSALHAAQRGIANAHVQAASAADEIVRATTTDTVSLSGRGPEPGDAVRGMIDLRVARYQQTAHLATYKTVDEMSRELSKA